MNKTMFAAVFATLALCAGAVKAAEPVKSPALDKTYLIGEAVGKDSPYYKVGDEIVYSMKLRGVGEGLKADDWTITCPPIGLWMLYNAVPCEKSIHWVQSSTHGTVPPKPNQTFDEFKTLQ